MRITQGMMTKNFLSDLAVIQRDIARLQQMAATGRAFERPRDNPSAVATSLDLRAALAYLNQYRRNSDDGLSRLSFTETVVYGVNIQLQRVRELTVQGANTYLTRQDRRAIALETDQLLEQVITLAVSNYRGRYIFSGYKSLTESFALNSNTDDALTNSVTYRGDSGIINRNIGIGRDLGINFSGKEVFLEQTYEMTGKQLSGEPLGFSGVFEINEQLFVVSQAMTIADVRDRINANTETEVRATVTGDHRLVLTSLNSSYAIKVREISGSVLEDLGILPQGAFNLAQSGPALPLIDSRGAIHTSAPVIYPITLTTATQDMVVTLGGAANDGFTQTEVLTLDAITYSSSAEMAAELQKKADLAFGDQKLIVIDLGGGVLEIETFVQSGAVLVGDLVLGGTTSDGTVDTVSDILGFNAVPSVPEVADTPGFDGNDRFTIDLGLGAFRTIGDEEPLDLPLVEINIDAAVALTIDDLVIEINEKILASRLLSGLVEAVNDGGRLRIQTTKQGGSVVAQDLILANAVLGPVAPPTDTLGALGFYVDPLTGVSDPPVPAIVFSTAPFPPGIGAIVAGFNDQLAIDLGPGASNDGTNPPAETITLTPGIYGTAAALAAEINAQIGLSPVLKNAVVATVRSAGGFDFVDIETTNVGSRVQADDLVLSDIVAGTLANLGLLAATTPGGGSADGQGIIELPHNIIDTLIKIRDELFGYAAPTSRLVDLRTEDGASLGLTPGDTITINSDGSSLSFIVQRFTTMQDLADRIEEQLGFQLEVQVLRDGRIEVFNPGTNVVNGISIEAFNQKGGDVALFEEAMSGISGKLVFNAKLRSETVYEDSRFERLTQRIGDMDDGAETILSTLAEIGSRHRRLEMTLAQSDSVEVTLLQIQTKNDFVDMAETIIRLKAKENVLLAALGTGARILTPSLFDFLR
ncbi:flagellar hook-associated protein FlgL [bacterium]|nr:flagellar hook-associated protein FlgL [bacterium]